MTKLNSNGGDDKVDELLKERYDLAKDRIVEICTETTVKPDFLDFFQNMAAFLEKTAVILERDEEKLSRIFHVGNRRPGAAGRAGRAEAGSPPDSVHHA